MFQISGEWVKLVEVLASLNKKVLSKNIVEKCKQQQQQKSHKEIIIPPANIISSGI